jgi:hypothetical protein
LAASQRAAGRGGLVAARFILVRGTLARAHHLGDLCHGPDAPAGWRLQLEPFIIVAIIAVVRHILSIAVRLAIPGAPTPSRFGLT